MTTRGELKQKEVAQALEIIATLATELHNPKSGMELEKYRRLDEYSLGNREGCHGCCREIGSPPTADSRALRYCAENVAALTGL
jgi:hypothetical protein